MLKISFQSVANIPQLLHQLWMKIKPAASKSIGFCFSDKPEHIIRLIAGACFIYGAAILLLYQVYLFIKTDIWISYSVITVINLGIEKGVLSSLNMHRIAEDLPGLVTVFSYTPIHIVSLFLGLILWGNNIAVSIGKYAFALVIIVTCVVALIGCASPVGSTTGTNGIIIAQASEMTSCKFLGDVHSISPFYGLFAAPALESARQVAMQQASKLGATHIVWNQVTPVHGSTTISGNAYSCKG